MAPKKAYKEIPYADDPDWSDVVPIPQDDGGPNALATIAYTDEYREATSYLRAVMAANEQSERALYMTEHIINLNPAHYTVWLYRAKIIETLARPIPRELEWLNAIALKFIKNYQIWHHRQTLLSRLRASASPEQIAPVLRREHRFLEIMLSKDAKNYHVWSYRQWLVQTFDMFDEATYGELAATENWLSEDLHNASAWNHRWFLIFCREQSGKGKVDTETWQREWAYAQAAIADFFPSNECPWNYLKAMVKLRGKKLGELKQFCEFFVDPAMGAAGVRSRPALRCLADIIAAEAEEAEGDQAEERKKVAGALYESLEVRFDPVRARYWRWKREQLGVAATLDIDGQGNRNVSQALHA